MPEAPSKWLIPARLRVYSSSMSQVIKNQQLNQMLALSATSQPDELSNIVKSTAAVIFLGTPHRGSPDLSALGAWARSVLSGLRFQTTSAILDTLGLKTTDLERSQEAFSGLWLKHGFRVKTFQEGYPMSKINLGVLGNKVVPDTSSLLGDQREQAETLQANHMEMCRFSGREDPNFVKVVGELRSVYLAILTGTIHAYNTDQPVAFNATMLNTSKRKELSALENACLRSLQFPYMHRRRQLIEDPAPQTGRWLIENETYSRWLFDRELQERPCILWLKGKPGAGKSTLMKQAFRHAKASLNSSEYCIAGFFINGKEFWGQLSKGENNGRVRVCLSSRHYPQISFSSASELIAEDLNEGDISRYVNQRLNARISGSDSRWEPKLRDKITDNAGGIFLWVTLTMDSLLLKYDQGKNLEVLLRDIDSMPWELESLFTEMVASISPELREVALRAFQWALMSTTPLRLHQWHHVLAFIKTPIPKSLKEWRKSGSYTESDGQLEREIKALTGGLLQVSAARSGEVPPEDNDCLSIRAGAGSLDLEQGETRFVQVIHQSVREFFLEGGGFRFLSESAARNPIINCHITIAMTCLDYICISELDDLVATRGRYIEQEAISPPERVPSEKPSRASSGNAEEPNPQRPRNRPRGRNMGQKDAFAEHLVMIPMPDRRADIASWIGAGNIPTNPATPAASIRYANSLLSAANGPRLLEDWPSLLFYVTASLGTHLRAAKRPGSDSPALLRLVDDEALWHRFVLLKEDIPWGATVNDLIVSPESASLASSIPFTGASRRSWSPRRAGSVASFASASSYGAMPSHRSDGSINVSAELPGME
ncbi:hypothetical protein CEP52_009148 [Fusarium oligoseptatum]|uniref:Nephrocystin 3-like N-terminal domain-containing protein n=1 Tax=Fusarium oligoseptatum TaxID=2604345 RepID=A0A428TEF3_9HYPO|nr:hypothetical protein CEP52_009148 [Fusarium oligoseptatum]